MVDRGFIEAKDFNLNILQGPRAYRIDVLPLDIKLRYKEDFEKHLDWLRPQDPLQRATSGFEAAIKFMMETDNSQHLAEFWNNVTDLDWSRNESLMQVVPELRVLLEYKPKNTRV
jgi:hypothetical protein